LSGPEGLRPAIRSAYTNKQCKLCAIKVINQPADYTRVSKNKRPEAKKCVNNSFLQCSGKEDFCSNGRQDGFRVDPSGFDPQ
jgi:hypothetical protein